ncbi:MAG TPA: hypothetical protein VJA16_14585 [Thermoanaerobaculia bacterium]
MTLRGKPVAELLPLGAKTGGERRREEIEQVVQEIDDLARSIARAWKSPKTATELVKEQRR